MPKIFLCFCVKWPVKSHKLTWFCTPLKCKFYVNVAFSRQIYNFFHPHNGFLYTMARPKPTFTHHRRKGKSITHSKLKLPHTYPYNHQRRHFVRWIFIRTSCRRYHICALKFSFLNPVCCTSKFRTMKFSFPNHYSSHCSCTSWNPRAAVPLVVGKRSLRENRSKKVFS